MSSPTRTSPSPRLAAIVARYRAVAVVALNLALLLLFLNVVLGVGYAIHDLRRSGVYGPGRKYPEASLAAVYPDLTAAQRNALLKETWSRTFVFADYLMFKERPFTGEFVNVSPHGFRFVRNQGPWPPSPDHFNVFVFGGSTTFGYGVADGESVASHLQEILDRHSKKRVCVYNFAAGFYYSTQERLLLEKLLREGHVPQLAIFIDGLNDSESPGDRAANCEMLEEVFNQPKRVFFLGQGAERIPMIRLARSLADNLTRARRKAAGDAGARAERQQLLQSIPTYRGNLALIEAVCQRFGVVPVFVWQPVPGYAYDLDYHLFADRRRAAKQNFFYDEMRKSVEHAPLGTNFLWCADLQRDAKECLYVDSVHYTSKFSGQLAEAISHHLRDRGLIGPLKE